jgi:hypothetical protein
MFVAAICMMMGLWVFQSIRPVAGDAHPMGGASWTLNSGLDYTIDQSFTMTGSIHNYGNMTIRDCTVTSYDNVRSIYNYPGARLYLTNVTFVGRDSQGGTAYGGVQVINKEELYVHGCSFSTMRTNPLFSNTPFVATNTTFSKINTDAIMIDLSNRPATFGINITGCQFVEVEGYSILTSYLYESELMVGWNISKNVITRSRGFSFNVLVNSTVSWNTFTDFVQVGIGLYELCQNVTMENNQFVRGPVGIEVYGTGWVTQNHKIQNNSLSDTTSAAISFDCGNVTFTNNTIQIKEGSGFQDYAATRANWINKCTITLQTGTSQAVGINVQVYNENTMRTIVSNDTTINSWPVRSYHHLRDANIDLAWGRFGKLIINNCSNVNVSKARVIESDNVLVHHYANSILSDILVNKSRSTGLVTLHTTNITIQNATVTNCGNFGIILNRGQNEAPFWTFNNTLRNITATKNRNGGIRAFEVNNTLLDSNVSSNLGSGLIMGRATNWTINNTQFVQNQVYGVDATTASGTLLSYCNFSQNWLNLVIASSTAYLNATECTFSQVSSRNNIESYNATNTMYHNHYSGYWGFDSNDDGVGDIAYVTNGTEPLTDTSPKFVDADGDGLDYFQELFYGTDPSEEDTDDDDLNDFAEIYPQTFFAATLSTFKFTLYPTNPLLNDTDGDGLLDGEELLVSKSNPNSRDTDGDFYTDDIEVAEGSDPTDPWDWPGRIENTAYVDNEENVGETEPDRTIRSIPGYPPLWNLAGVLAVVGVMRRIRKSITGGRG